MTQLIVPGNATPAQVLNGQTFSAGTNYNASGSMPNNGAVTLTPSGTGTVPIPAGYHNGSGEVAQVTVPASDVLTGTTIAGVGGTMPNNGSPTVSQTNSSQSLSPGYYNGISVPALTHGSQTFTSNGTFTVPSGVYSVFAIVIGGGGSGGSGEAINGAGSYYGGGGGGSGGCAYGNVAVTPGQNISVTIGTGGTGVYGSGSSASAGNPGTASSFSSLTGNGGGAGGQGYPQSGTAGTGGGYSGTHGVNGNSGQPGGTQGDGNPAGGAGGQPVFGYGSGGVGIPATNSTSGSGSSGAVILLW